MQWHLAAGFELNARLTSITDLNSRLGMYRIPVSVVLLLLFLSARSMDLTVEVNAQAQYTIPVNWQLPPGQVKIAVPATPKWAHDAVLDAMRIWNEGQLWFKEKYFKTGEVYTLIESASGIEVRFVYRDQSNTGTILETPKGRVISLRLTDSNNNTISDAVLASCTAHELGHILGLGHTSVHLDLMWGLVVPGAPSTLDLYAVHLLAGGLKERVIVTLPSNIPYVAVPEYADSARSVSKTTKTVSSTTQAIRVRSGEIDYAPYTIAVVSVIALLLAGFIFSRRRTSFSG